MTQGFAEMEGLAPEGFISAYQHKEPLEFVKVGDGENQGYFRIPQKDIESEMHTKNLIVTRASVFMANRMRPGTSWGNGIQYLDIGTGVGTGTTQSPQGESASYTQLRQALARKAITSWTYLDTAGAPTGTETNILQLTTTFEEAEAIGAIVEMGLFGGSSATTNVNTGYMFNYKAFPVWNKQSGMRLTVVWRLTF